MRGKRTSHDPKSSRENNSEAKYNITREKRAPNLGCNGWTKPTQIYVNIDVLEIMLQHHKVCGGGLIKWVKWSLIT